MLLPTTPRFVIGVRRLLVCRSILPCKASTMRFVYTNALLLCFFLLPHDICSWQGCGMHGESSVEVSFFSTLYLSKSAHDMLFCCAHMTRCKSSPSAFNNFQVRCALYGIDVNDRCPNWRGGIYKPCQVGEDDAKKDAANNETRK